MSNSTTKKRARELQAITGMPYQAAQRAIVDGTEYQASIRSDLMASDFVTPREIRIWHEVNGTGALDCARGRHWMATEALGQCVGCGACMMQMFDDDGQSYETTIEEDQFILECVATEMYYEWAPPLSLLNGQTQREYVSQEYVSRGRPSQPPRATTGVHEWDVVPWDLESGDYDGGFGPDSYFGHAMNKDD